MIGKSFSIKSNNTSLVNPNSRRLVSSETSFSRESVTSSQIYNSSPIDSCKHTSSEDLNKQRKDEYINSNANLKNINYFLSPAHNTLNDIPSPQRIFNAQLPPQLNASFYASDTPIFCRTTVKQRPISRDQPPDFNYAMFLRKRKDVRKHYDIDFRIMNF